MDRSVSSMSKFKIEEPLTEAQVAFIGAVLDDAYTDLTSDSASTSDLAHEAENEENAGAIEKVRALIDRDTIWNLNIDLSCDYCGASFKAEKKIPKAFFCPVCGQRNQYVAKVTKGFNYNIAVECDDQQIGYLNVMNKDLTTRCRIYDKNMLRLFIEEHHDPVNQAIKRILAQPVTKKAMTAEFDDRSRIIRICFRGYLLWEEHVLSLKDPNEVIFRRIDTIYRGLMAPMNKL